MEKRISIIAGEVKSQAVLDDSQTATAIWKALPIKDNANLWGDEVYFEIPVSLDLDGGRETVDAGDLGYWPSGRCFCIFFGPTPMSRSGEIRPASAVNVFGKIDGDPLVFKRVQDGEAVLIERAP